MPSKHDQPIIRLLSIAAVSTGMLLAQVGLVAPAASTVWAAESSHTTTQAEHAKSAPESNPYADSTQCTYRAWDLAAKAGHKLPWFAGDAKNWNEGATEHGLKVSDTIDTSVVGSVAVWEAGVDGTGYAGHVGYVVEVKGDKFRVQERNWTPAADGERWVTWQKGISFIKLEEPKPAPSTDSAPTNSAPARGSSPAQAASASEPAPAETPRNIDSVQPLVQQFVVHPWQPGEQAGNALADPLPDLVKINLWAPHLGAKLNSQLSRSTLVAWQ